ncbi:MAG: fumarylacetoacetate hydrolase family protein [Pseudomonadota bacterium]
MGVAVVRYALPDTPTRWGIVRDQTVHTLNLEGDDHRELMRCYFESRETFEAAIGGSVGTLSEVTLSAPLRRDIQLLCQGLNYADHRLEGGLDKGDENDENLLFFKAASSICGPNDAIVRPPGCELLDYEIELGLVLKNTINRPVTITEDRLQEWVGGLVIANDVSARDFMFGAPAMQWFRGKSQRTFCPLGPVLYLMDSEDFQQLYNLKLTLNLNDELRQEATTDQLIHKPAKTLTELSSFVDLRTGDCLLTGTPGGVQVGVNTRSAIAILLNMRNDKKRREKFVSAQLARAPFLQPGDRLHSTIQSLDGSIQLGEQYNIVCDI